MTCLGYFNEASLVISEGLPGSGKSYMAAQTQVEWLMSGNPVLTNLRIRSIPKLRIGAPGEYVFLEDEDFDPAPVVDENGLPVMETYESTFKGETVIKSRQATRLKLLDKLAEIKEVYPNSHPLLLIDECHDIFNARKWKDNDKGGFFSWIAQHRHMGISVLLITQHHSMLDKALRVRAQEFLTHENLVRDSSMGMWLWVFGRNIHRQICYSNKGGAPNLKTPHQPKIFRIVNNKKSQRYSSGQMHKLSLKDSFKGHSDVPRKLVVTFLVCLVGWGSAIGSRAFWGEKPKPSPLAYEPEFETVEAPEFRAMIEGCLMAADGRVVLMTDQGDIKTTSTDIWEWSEKVGQEYVEYRPAVVLRPWTEDIVDQIKNGLETTATASKP